ncbi:MAG TPA: LodA/GoxA family CTQ-dependent oxidase [Candidatus Elarobacter sp.]|nr:LodA/GoxA family CTQ-dependent oxidase [Candidatus Elarobacter sp.]
MGIESIASVRIHPAIGIARVGNSESEYYLGPELPYPPRRPAGFYKDAEGKLKREAARFRVYGYDADGKVVAELTSANAEIAWTVHVANTKAAWYDFDVALDIPEATTQQSVQRNGTFTGDARKQLAIDPGPRTIGGVNAAPKVFDTGTFVGTKVYLGELRTDEAGRLIFLGGRGVSANFTGATAPVTFANNDGWHDDVSDGPVHAKVKVNGKTFDAAGAWVVVAPPNYGPDIVTPQTMYDVIYDALAGASLPSLKSKTPSFRDDVYPLLQQMNDAQWVNDGFLTTFGWGGPWDFTRDDLIDKLARPKPEHGDDTYRELRVQVFNQIRDPGETKQNPLQWPPIYGDAFGNYYDSPRVYFTITATKYGLLRKWSEGDFIGDWDVEPQHPATFDDVPLAAQPEILDRAALHWCMGGPFHPGCEMTWPMRQSSMYAEPFRLRERPASIAEPDYGPVMTQAIVLSAAGPLAWNGPGDVSRWMAVPWQTDTASCRSGYTGWPGNPYNNDTFIPTFWPSRVPNDVLTQGAYEIVIDQNRKLEDRMLAFYHRVRWLRGFDYSGPYIPQITKMITEFGDLGVVEARENPNAGDPNDPFPATLYVESRPTVPTTQPVLMKAHEERATLRPSEEFAFVRFGGLGRR